MLYCFDLDDTLISGYLGNPDKDYHTWKVLPNRVDRLLELQARGDTICIVTNQGGVAFGYTTELDYELKIGRVIDALQLGPLAFCKGYVCFADARSPYPYYADPAQAARRKPSGAMIREAMSDWPEAAALGVLMVGDREEDEAAARDAGIAFQWAHIFFKDG